MQLGVDLTRQDSDHFPLNLSVQCVPPTGLPAPDSGDPLPLLSWDMSSRQAYATTIADGRLDACVPHARCGDLDSAFQQLSDAIVEAARSAGCRYKAAQAQPATKQPSKRQQPFYDRECLDMKRLFRRMRSQDPEVAHALKRKYAGLVRRKRRQYRQLQTGRLLREIRSRPRDFWRKLNGRPAQLPPPLRDQSAWQQYMAGLSAAPSPTIPSAPAVASRTAPHVANELNGPITVADVKDALPLLNNGRSGAAQGWPAVRFHS